MRKIDIGVIAEANPQPLFKVTANNGDKGEVDVMHIYAPTSSTQRSNVLAVAPKGSFTTDSTSGKMFVRGASTWEAISST